MVCANAYATSNVIINPAMACAQARELPIRTSVGVLFVLFGVVVISLLHNYLTVHVNLEVSKSGSHDGR